MTVTYSLDVASASFCGIHKLLFRWKGSIWKSIWPELLLWLSIYAAISFTYRFGLDSDKQKTFEDVVVFFYTYGDYIPLTFILGFYVSAVFERWKNVMDNLGWVDSPGLLVATYIKGQDQVARNIRRNIIRYMVLVQAMVFRDISTSVKVRFPTMDHLVTAGLMTANELKEFDSIISPQLKYWVPMNWVFLLVRKARELQMIDSDIIYTDLLEKIRQYRVNVLTLTVFDWIPIPLVYTQVVNLAVRSYFVICLLGRQYVIHKADVPSAKTIDMYVPIMTILQFLFYIGWMKVAEVLLNPMGDDDDDFELNWIIDRNLQVGLSMVDDACERVPAMEKDIFWNDVLPEVLYTSEAAERDHNPMIGSCNDLAGSEFVCLQPPRNRFMSAGTINPLTSTDFSNERGEIPVRKHNPSARSASVYSDSGRNSSVRNERNRFLASFKRKISKGQRKSDAAVHDYPFSHTYADWERDTHNNNGIPRIDVVRPESAGRWTSGLSRNDSVCSSNFIDGVHTPFAQSLPAHMMSQKSPPDNSTIDPNTLNGMLEQLSSKNNDEGQHNNSWMVNEMLPVIQEEDHDKSRKSTVKHSPPNVSMEELVMNHGPRSPPPVFGESTNSFEKLKQALKAADSVSSAGSTINGLNPDGSIGGSRKVSLSRTRTTDNVSMDALDDDSDGKRDAKSESSSKTPSAHFNNKDD